MSKTSVKRLLHLVLFGILIFLDQLTKFLAISELKEKADVVFLKGILSFSYLENRGAAWGMLSGKRTLLLVIAAVMLAVILYFYFKIPMDKKYAALRILLVFVAAGAIGNVIDRVKYQYVVDFFRFDFINFPIFNVADIYITCSVIFLIVLMLFVYKDDLDTPKSANSENTEKDETSGE